MVSEAAAFMVTTGLGVGVIATSSSGVLISPAAEWSVDASGGAGADEDALTISGSHYM